MNGEIQFQEKGRVFGSIYGMYLCGDGYGKEQWQLFVNRVGNNIVEDTLSNALLLCRSLNGSEWEKKYSVVHTGMLTITAFEVPLSDGWQPVNAIQYLKTIEGLIVLQIAIKATADHVMYDVIATLPAGFRPADAIEFSAVKKPAEACTLTLNTDGTIQLIAERGVSSGGYLFADLVFVAAS